MLRCGVTSVILALDMWRASENRTRWSGVPDNVVQLFFLHCGLGGRGVECGSWYTLRCWMTW
jgi:hypothetical protein